MNIIGFVTHHRAVDERENFRDIQLPEGALIIEREPVTGYDVKLALKLAAIGAPDEDVEAIGGKEALDQVKADRKAQEARSQED